MGTTYYTVSIATNENDKVDCSIPIWDGLNKTYSKWVQGLLVGYK